MIRMALRAQQQKGTFSASKFAFLSCSRFAR